MQNVTSVLQGCLAAALLAAAAQAQTYNITIINPPAGSATGRANSINATGQAVGYTTVKIGKSTVFGPAFFWDRGQSSTLAPLSGQASAEATRISDSGLIVGGPNSLSFTDTGRATWWEKTSSGYQPRDWNTLLQPGTGLTLLRADSLSDDGRYVSFQANDGPSGLRDIIAEVQLDSTGLVPLGFVQFWDVTVVWGVTDIAVDGAGTVRACGLTGPDQNTPGAFLWLKDLAGGIQYVPLDSSADTGAWAVNSVGEAAGSRHNSAGYRALYWNASAVMQDIGTLGGTAALAHSINDTGWVVGSADTAGKGKTSGVSHAFLWHSGTDMRDLNSLKSASDTSGIELTSAWSINSAGQILASGTFKTGSSFVLLSPQ